MRQAHGTTNQRFGMCVLVVVLWVISGDVSIFFLSTEDFVLAQVDAHCPEEKQVTTSSATTTSETRVLCGKFLTLVETSGMPEHKIMVYPKEILAGTTKECEIVIDAECVQDAFQGYPLEGTVT